MYRNKAPQIAQQPTDNRNAVAEPCSLTILYSNRCAPVLATVVPENSMLFAPSRQGNSCSYLTAFNDASDQVLPEDIADAFVQALPYWFRMLLGSHVTVLHTTNSEIVLQLRLLKMVIHISLLLSKPRRHSAQKNMVLSTVLPASTKAHSSITLFLQQLFQNRMPELVKRTILHLKTTTATPCGAHKPSLQQRIPFSNCPCLN